MASPMLSDLEAWRASSNRGVCLDTCTYACVYKKDLYVHIFLSRPSDDGQRYNHPEVDIIWAFEDQILSTPGLIWAQMIRDGALLCTEMKRDKK